MAEGKRAGQPGCHHGTELGARHTEVVLVLGLTRLRDVEQLDFRGHDRDDGHEFAGTDEIRRWLATAASEFTFTRTLVSAEATEAGRWLVVNHLEGDFPGGVVDLCYEFAVGGDLISELVIAP
jgi:hypothetical protein